MNTLKTILSGILLLLCLISSAQKTASAPDLPYSNKILLIDQALESLFGLSANISVELGTGFHIEGKILNKTFHGNSGISLLIKVYSQPGGMLNISRFIDSHGKIYYTGRLLKLHEPNGMMLLEKDQHYYFVETQQRFLLSE
jgi:hypothetical protein